MFIVSFVEKVGSELKRLFKSTIGSSTFTKTVQATITYVAPILETILTLVDPAIAPIVARVIGIVQADLATVSVVVQHGKVAPGTPGAVAVETALNSIKENLSGLLAVAEVKNSSKIQEITASVNLNVGETDALLNSLPTAA